MIMDKSKKLAWLDDRTKRTDNDFSIDVGKGTFVVEIVPPRRRFLGIPLSKQQRPNPDYFLTQRDIDIQRNLIRSGMPDDLDFLSDMHKDYTKVGYVATRRGFDADRSRVRGVLANAVIKNASALLNRADVKTRLTLEERNAIGFYINRNPYPSPEEAARIDAQIAVFEAALQNPSIKAKDFKKVKENLVRATKNEEKPKTIHVGWKTAVLVVLLAGASLAQSQSFRSEAKEAARNVRDAVENMFGTEDVSQENNSAETVAQISQDAGDQVTSTTQVGTVEDTGVLPDEQLTDAEQGGLMADLDEAEMKPVSYPFTEEQLSNFKMAKNANGLKTANEIFTDFVNGDIKYNEMLRYVEQEIRDDSGIQNFQVIVPVKNVMESYKNYTVRTDPESRINVIKEFNRKLLANGSVQLMKDRGVYTTASNTRD